MMQSSEVLSELDGRRARARARAAAGWLPLLLTGLALLGAFPAYAGRWGGTAGGGVRNSVSVSQRLGLFGLGGGSPAVGLYWLVVIPVVYAASALWFSRAARRTGLHQRWGVHLLAGTGTFAVLVCVAAAGWVPPSKWGLLTPMLALAVGLVALGTVEHDRVVAAAGVAVAAVAVIVGALAHHTSSLSDSGLGNVAQSLLAPSVEVAGVGLALVAAAALVRSAKRRAASRPAAAFVPAAP
ncbi:MAG: hypothetical protein QOI82_3562 [Actinomycetota bacterium]|jgi:hypothetical protein|nr:hypothetical protein [Actinomycetota bacterium]